MSRYALGKTLTWLGILVWVPFILLTIGKYSPPILPFLVVHLIGILGGAWIKRTNSPVENANSLAGKSPARRIGSILILLGVAVRVIYFTIKNFTAMEVSLAPFLILQLSAVVPGLMLRLGLFDWVRIGGFKRRQADEPTPSLD
jgi:hypothetical protein